MACLTAESIGALPAQSRILELGCGQVRHSPSSVAVDRNPDSKADVIHDLNVRPYPFEDSEFDLVIAEHVLEHLDDLVGVVEELHRILKPGGRLLVEVPHFSSVNFFTDPTHRHSFSTKSFDYFVPGTELHRYRYSHATFGLCSARLLLYDEHTLVRKLVSRQANKHPFRYERHWAFIFPAAAINFELECLK